MKRQIDVYRRTLRVLSLVLAVTCSHRALAQEGAVTRLDLPLGRAYPYRADEVITRVTVANPQVGDAIVISEREIVINAISSGEGDIILWLQSGRRVHFRVQVHTAADRMQVSIGVKFAEVRRDALREIGVSAIYRDDNVRVGAGNFSNDANFNPATGAITLPSATRFLTVLTDFGTDDLLAFLDAQEQSGNAHLLAEPTIITANRELGTFLAGGEIPIPVVQGLTGNITIVYKEFGVRLNFTPTIAGDVIRLKLRPEVSSLDYNNGIIISGFRIPALLSRRAETDVELRDGQSFAIAGLMNNISQEDNQAVPVLSKLPIIGNLFKSRADKAEQTELMVLITPRLVRPLDPDEVPPLPTEPGQFIKPEGEGNETGTELTDAPAPPKPVPGAVKKPKSK